MNLNNESYYQMGTKRLYIEEYLLILNQYTDQDYDCNHNHNNMI